MRHLSILLALVCSAVLSSAQSQPSACVFVGCVCDGGEPQRSDSSESAAAADPDYVAPEGGGGAQNTEPYQITCNVDTFPERDTSRWYSNSISTLEIIDKPVREIPGGRLAGLEIELADFAKNKIESIAADAFAGVLKLEILDVGYNHLAELAEGTMAPVNQTLFQLKVQHNQLGRMNPDALSAELAPLRNLNVLILSHNHVERLPDLTRLSSLQELSLDNNMIRSLVDEATNRPLLPESLIELGLKENRLTQLNENSFANLRNLKYLNLESNQINSIGENTFGHLHTLITLNLAKNYINHIPSRLFHSLVHVDRIDLSSQNQMLRQIDNYAFDRRSNARVVNKIDLSNNRIAKLEERAFCSRNKSAPYVNIKEIDLAANSLTGLSACLARQLAKGYEAAPRPSSAGNAAHHSHRAKISFKPNQANQLVTDALKCDCEITKAAHLVDFEGDCKTAEGVSVPLKQYQCGVISSLTSSPDEIERACTATPKYDCVEHAEEQESEKESHEKMESGESKENMVPDVRPEPVVPAPVAQPQPPKSDNTDSIQTVKNNNVNNDQASANSPDNQANKDQRNQPATKQPSAAVQSAAHSLVASSSLFALLATLVASTALTSLIAHS